MWYVVCGKMLMLQKKKCFPAIRQVFIVVVGQMLKNNLAIWSHCDRIQTFPMALDMDGLKKSGLESMAVIIQRFSSFSSMASPSCKAYTDDSRIAFFPEFRRSKTTAKFVSSRVNLQSCSRSVVLSK